MSYDSHIIKDSAAAYWSFSGTSTDLVKGKAANVFNNAPFVYPPIITNSGSTSAALKIIPSSSVVLQSPTNITNGVTRNDIVVNKFNKDFSISFWFNFNNQLNGSGLATTPYLSNKLNIFNIKDITTDTTLANVYYDYLTNTFRFSVAGTGNTEAHYLITNMEQNFYIVLTYSNGSISIIVNDEKGVPGKVVKTSTLFTTTDANISFSFDGKSLTGTASLPGSFLVSSLAFFNLLLHKDNTTVTNKVGKKKVKKTVSGIQQHMVWANNDGKPIYSSMLGMDSFFKIGQHPHASLGISQTISGNSFKSQGILSNMTVGNNGLMLADISSPTFKPESTTSASSLDTASGISFTGKSSIQFDNPERYVNLLNGGTISAQISNRSGTSNKIFSLTNINGKSNISAFLESRLVSSSWHYYFGLYDSVTSTSTVYIDQNIGSASAASANIAVSFTDKTVTLYTSEGSASTASYNNTYTKLDMSNSKLVIGNLLAAPNNGLNLKIKNFGLYNQAVTNFSTFDFTAVQNVMFRFTSSTYPFLVSKKGTWTLVVPASKILNCYLLGTHFDWTSMDNCLVETSVDGGVNWKRIKRGESATNYNSLLNNYAVSSKNFLLRVTMVSEAPFDTKSQTFNNLSYNIYDNLDLYSDVAFYKIQKTDSKVTTNYTVGSSDSILIRKNNFGIKFAGDDTYSASSKPPGSASITVGGNRYYNAIEMWYRPDSITSGSTNHILSNVSGSINAPAIWLDTSSRFNYSGSLLYVNGASVANATYTASAGELYHLILTLQSASNVNVYLNGENLGSGAVRSRATYGYIQFRHKPITPSEVLGRNQSFFYMNSASVTDSNTTKLISNTSSEQYKVTRIG